MQYGNGISGVCSMGMESSVPRTREYEERVQSLSIELEGVRSRLQVAERQASQPSPFVLRLQSEMTSVKVRIYPCSLPKLYVTCGTENGGSLAMGLISTHSR